MISLWALTPALAGGILLGIVFFGGLWWTVQRIVSSTQPALLVLGSLLLRTAVVVVGFYFVSLRDWHRVVACLIGFVIARILVSTVTLHWQRTSMSAAQGGSL
jgi:F1F0 ATPase subunit 2